MLCQKCKKNNATSHIHYVLNGVVRDAYLCTECAKGINSAELYDNEVFKMLSSLLKGSVKTSENSKVCEICGTDFNKIRQTGKVGCSNCYKVFENELSPTVARLHGKTIHVGKKPHKTSEPDTVESHKDDTKLQRINELKAQLAEAVSREEFEKAAIIRDKIKEEEA